MSLSHVLGSRRIALLRQRLHLLLETAPAQGLLSITLELDSGQDDWLSNLPTLDLCRTHTTYWARPNCADHRLALGCAMLFTTSGTARFSALQAAFSGLAPGWQHDDSQNTGATPSAHIGFAFDEEAQDNLPNARLVVPAILLQNRHGRSTATFSCAVRDADEAIAHWLAELHACDDTAASAFMPCKLQRRATPLADRAFLARARAALADIAKGQLEKIVLTRSVHFDAAEPLPVSRLIATLGHHHPECTLFSIGHHGQGFVGATPERLVALERGMVHADALAGTAWLSTAPTDNQPGSLKLQDDKNSREQQLVVDAVRAALAPLCVVLEQAQAPEIMQLRELQHLRTGIAGRVCTEVGLFDLIARLHPTPAVGGTPGAAARHWLTAHGDQRGAWYTGGIGWISRDGDGDIMVALRCAYISGKQAELFAGAGIVAGSDPAQELAETEAKLGTIIGALQHLRPHDAAKNPGKTGTQ